MQQLPGREGRVQGSSPDMQEDAIRPKPMRGQAGDARDRNALRSASLRVPPRMSRASISRLSISATVPPIADPEHVGVEGAERSLLLQRADDMSTIRGMLNKPHTSAVNLSGEPGVGKSTLAGLVYYEVRNGGGMRHVVWVSLGPYATLPDVIAAVLCGIGSDSGDFFLLTPEQQIGLLVQALGRPQETAFIVLDSFEELLTPESGEGLPGRGAIGLFLETLRDVDIGASRVLLTSTRSLSGYGTDTSAMGTINRSLQKGQELHIRSYLVSRVSIPEGMALLHQWGVQGSHSELSLIWQRCGGHVFALVLFSVLTHLSGFSLSYLLNSPDYAPMWNGEVTRNLIETVYYFLNPIQRTLLRALCLFAEPVPLDAIATAIVGESAAEEERAMNRVPTASNEESNAGSPYKAFQGELSALVRMSLVQEQVKGIGEHSYFLHPLLRQYTLEHYLEGRDHSSPRLPVPQTGLPQGMPLQTNAYRSGHPQGMPLQTNVLGVAAPEDPAVRHPEAWHIALAAGHMRVAAYYARLAQEYCPPREQRTGLADVEPIVAMIQHLCLGWHWQEAYNLLRAEGLYEHMLQWGAFNTLIGLYTAMLPPLGVVSRHDFGEMCGQLGVLYGRLGEDAQSQAYYEQALAVFREVGDGYAQAVTLANEGELFRGRGEWEKAQSIFEQALTLNSQYSDEHLQSVILHNLGLLYQARKDYATALRCYVESLKLAHGLPVPQTGFPQGVPLQERYNEGMILSNMGFLLFEQGHLPDAIALLSYAVQLRQSLHDPAVGAVIDFLHVLEQKMGSEAFARLRSSPSANYNLGSHDLISRLLSSGPQ